MPVVFGNQIRRTTPPACAGRSGELCREAQVGRRPTWVARPEEVAIHPPLPQGT